MAGPQPDTANSVAQNQTSAKAKLSDINLQISGQIKDPAGTPQAIVSARGKQQKGSKCIEQS
jgi:hypothetical protein